jgi:hypothetical protein
MTKQLFILSMLATSSLLTGCSTLTAGGTSQNVAVFTATPEGKDVNEVRCEMTNDEGTWSAITPASVMIHRSNKDMQIVCKKDGFESGHATVVSKTKANMFGNIIFGGGIGAIIDHNNGSAYEYPPSFKVVMGRTNRIEATQTIEPKATETTKSN